MKQIYFIRHAKAEAFAQTDFERKLSQKGEDDAGRLGELLAKEGIKPDIIITSPAKRALKTAKIIAKNIGAKDILKEKKELYDISARELAEFVRMLDEKYKVVFIVGHNPTIGAVCEYFSNSVIEKFPTCAIFGLEFEAENFAEISEHSGKVLLFDYPNLHLQ
ncbi:MULTISPECIES: SixA phosphatase family protein [unclassified Campylobacter]|uniref:SixA phosphatase family protein n=1 Tax=unclassified Campylobacter TaxID=2593542 RepID=UPI0022E9E650|nr:MULTISPECIES: histidine phosphatase family protein [unclassified Campylobacter]MDA3043549.1 histidine phosphatase family protein [Campylobacter sp. JMF_09 ED2]MDA3044096.1 histidine phosphatase family protein [Campylobacter sp. JMF_07 ED4]MDA3063446.1 histidine phosphatase family protein [Campylobacter sp. JMF_11 EL3]MDA3071071.1 histidine phosphatase family protein [Campylobacter sp. VBCF_03 NA9]MDA3074531.1 histidine phosphatase family protein [Campylobacter sp. JMF_05 ED3]